MSEWISVEDRLPEYREPVLVWFGGYEPHAKKSRVKLTNRFGTSAAGEQWDCQYMQYITHWMPLPEPPK